VVLDYRIRRMEFRLHVQLPSRPLVVLRFGAAYKRRRFCIHDLQSDKNKTQPVQSRIVYRFAGVQNG